MSAFPATSVTESVSVTDIVVSTGAEPKGRNVSEVRSGESSSSTGTSLPFDQSFTESVVTEPGSMGSENTAWMGWRTNAV
ncbi:hypothetical protein BHS09_02655 [Myxococcus xanthus]|uniref:Uncharacterized protein n=1 Tax=Myxococcus xanthus TaxID=34 RepID=A0AAE6FW37_MYXXA|nr:hypothetical protein BHS09_02655 [Myxococcus xanthus]QDE73256.1 hypothetical protein BHS08_02655 [Myxococcus xanthus]